MQNANKRRRQFVGWLALFLIVATGLVVTLWPNQYEARSILVIDEEHYDLEEQSSERDDQWSAASDLATEELSELQDTDSFIRLMISQSDLEANMSLNDRVVSKTIIDVRRSIDFSIVGEDKIEVIVTWDDPAVADQLATAMTESYSSWKEAKASVDPSG